MITTPVTLWREQEDVTNLLGKTGTLMVWTLIQVPAKGFAKESPYPVIIIKLDNNKKVIGQLVDWEKSDLKIGQRVIAVLRRLAPEKSENIIAYTIKFKPL